MNRSTVIMIGFAFCLPLLAGAFEKQADAINSARTNMNARHFAEALSDADAGMKLAINQAEKVAVLMLREQIVSASGDLKAALAEVEAVAGMPGLTDDQRAQALSRVACLKIDNGQADRIGADVAAIQGLPVSGGGIRALKAIADKVASQDPAAGEMILRDMLKKTGLTDAQKVDLLQGVFGLHVRRSDYATCKSILDEILKTAGDKGVRIEDTLVQFAAKAVEAAEFMAAEESYRKALSMAPENMRAGFGVSEMALMRGDGSMAQADLQKVIGNPKIPASQRYVARIIQLAASSPDAGAFRGQIAQADKEFASEKFTEDQRFKLLREAAARLFTAYRYDDVRALEAETGAMMRPEPEKTFACRYVKDVPRSADSWARSALIKDARFAETRFEPYPKGDELNSDLAKLKGAKAAEATPGKAGYDTRAFIVYDERGVHVYVQGDDPEARQIGQGLVSGGSLEFYFQPGSDFAYHQWFFNLPGTDDREQVNWDAPHSHYRNTYDYLVKDAVVTDGGVGAYTFIPWLLVYDKLPSESNRWIFSMQRNSKGGFVTLGGAVHELGRALELNFEMTREQLLAVKREIAARAYAKYQKDRNRPDGVALWGDPVLGDPAFDKAAVQPLLSALDKAGETINEKMTEAEVEMLFEKFVPDWMELAYRTAELRRAYLEQKFFGDR